MTTRFWTSGTRDPARGASGVALVLVAALLTLLLVAATGFLATVRVALLARGAGAAAAAARLAAESGLAYAAARLAANPFPETPRSAAGRGDDWIPRDPSEAGNQRHAPPLNPSYSHGEPWRDANGNGAYDPGEPFDDGDGDGRFSAWSGRLRPASAPLRFALRIASLAGRIPVNGGFLDAENRNGGPPDHRDLSFLAHAGLAHALNNLGAILLPAGHPRRWRIATANPWEPIDYSVLGDDLVGNRPPGGWRDLAHVQSVLEAILPPAAGYATEDWDLLEPYLDFSAPPPTAFGPPWTLDPAVAPTTTPMPRVELGSASEAVLESLWRYLTHAAITTAWEPGASSTSDPRSGGPVDYSGSRLVLFPDEARRLARAVIRYNAEGAPTWPGLYARLLAEAESMIPLAYPLSDPPDGLFQSGIDPAVYPTAHARYAQAKADLAFQSVSPDAHPFPRAAPRAWGSWGIARPDGRGDAYPFPTQVGWRDIRRIALPGAHPTDAYTPPHVPFQGGGGSPLAPLGLSLDPAGRWRATSLGTSLEGAHSIRAAATGAFRSHETLFLGSQEDFENRDGAIPLSGMGLSAVNDPVWPEWPTDIRRRGLAVDDAGSGARVYRHVASLPRWDLDSYPVWTPPPEPAGPNPNGYSRFFGALALAAREAGPRGADRYWALGETDAGLPAASGALPGDTPPGFPSESRAGGPTPVPWEGPVGPRSDIRPLNPNIAFSPTGALEPSFTPHQATGVRGNNVSPAVTLPGADIPDGEPIAHLAIEAWGARHGDATNERVILALETWVQPHPNPYARLSVSAQEVPPPASGVAYRLRLVNWPVGPDGPDARLTPPAPPPFLIPHRDSPGAHHLRLQIERTGQPPAEITWVRLYVDGVEQASLPLWPGRMYALWEDFLSIHRADEVRLYATEPAPDAMETFRLGRFVRRGVYRSPLYVLAGPGRLWHAQWTGITPADYPSPGISVSVIGYADPDGARVSGLLPLPADGRPAALAALGTVRAFRYEVVLAAPPAVAIVRDTPVFESIGFTFRRVAGPAWTTWETD